MSRRVLMPKRAAYVKARSRMAPGGLMWSESPVEPFWRPVGAAGEVPDAPAPPTGFYVDPSVSGANPAPPATQAGWLLRWANDTSSDLLPVGNYNITVTFKLTAVHPSATTITAQAYGFDAGAPYAEGPVVTITGGPFTVGQIVSVTFLASIPDVGDPDFYLLGANWHTGITTDYFTAVPA